MMRRSSLVFAIWVTALITMLASPATATGPLRAETAAKVRDFVTSALHELDVPAAAIVIVGQEGIEFAEGYGSASDGTPATVQTPFNIASLSKELTAIAVMQLVSSGDLSLDATVHSYVPWFGAEGGQTAKMTVRDLLAHTSGFSTKQGLANRASGDSDDGALERWVRRLAEVQPANARGTFEYSNANYDILGYLVAVASGTSYDAYMTERVLGPLQMTHTHLTEADARGDGLAQGHYPFFGIPVAWNIVYARSSVPSAFIYASAEALGHVVVAHLNRGAYGGAQVLSASDVALMHRPLTHPDAWDGYGWGWWSYPLWNAGRLTDGANGSQYDVPVILEHGGSQQTFASGMLLMPAAGIGVVVLMNLNDEVASSRFYQLHTGIAQILLGRDAPALASTDDLLAQNARLIGLAWVALLGLLVAWSVRRYRRWQRNPASAPRGRWPVVRRIGLPLAIVFVLTIGFWWLLLTKADESIASIAHIVQDAPDLALIALAVSLFGVSWGLIGTIWSVRLLRRGTPA